ncbi:MAG: methylenetetrahydrofolate reductase [NAD(P)H] [Nitrospirae bacterium]|nr:methylenetetrahydrofolate reductase [NAD(P)H] [Nitrospirota bacterium]
MKIRDLFNRPERIFSFEFFPPKTPEGEEGLRATIRDLKPLNPAFVSVTYGAGGSTRAQTIDLVSRIKRETGIESMAHLTCIGASRIELTDILAGLRSDGIENILALRGDPPKGETAFVPAAGGFAHASDLVAFIRAHDGTFCVGGAAYPEGHVESRSLDEDLRHLKTKVDAGCDFLITQLFFDNRFYFDFVGRARAAGIAVPILPGIMPVTNLDQLKRFTSMCGASIPEELMLRLEQAPSVESVREIGIDHAVRQCGELISRGASGIHFYTLNQSKATREILARIRSKDWGVA